jgi:hypothetical protein
MLTIDQKSDESSVMLKLLADGVHGYMATSTGAGEIGTCEVPMLLGTV